MGYLINLVRDNKRVAALSVAAVTLLVAFGFDAARVESIVGAVVAILVALLAGQGDTNAAVKEREGQS